jgi:hypothetical protein
MLHATSTGRGVVALGVLAPNCKCTLGVQKVVVDRVVSTQATEKQVSRQKTGTHMAKAIVKHAREELGADELVIVSDDITPHANRVIQGADMQYSRFSYSEATTRGLLDHFTQVAHFQILPPRQRKGFLAGNPSFDREAQRLRAGDALAKFYGCCPGDIVAITEVDPQVGFTTRHALVIAE